MRALILSFIIALIGTAVAGTESGTSSIARGALDAALQGDFETFSSLSNESVRSALPREAFAGIAPSLELQFGGFVDVLGVDRSERDGYELFTFMIDYERAVVKMLVVLDAEEKVAGFRIISTEQKVEWQKPSYAEPSTFSEEEVTVGAEGFPLPGTLSLPTSETRHPAVVLLHGSGPNDRDETIGPNRIFKDIAWGLASNGIAVLRYEKRTKALPAKFDVASATLEDEVIDDAVAAVTFLRGRSEVDSSRIFVLGHSLGGLAAPYVGKRDPRLAGTIVIAGPGQPMLDVLAYQIEHLSRLNGSWNDASKAEVERITQIAKRGRGGDDVSDETIMGMPANYWLDVDMRDAPAVASDTELPVLVIQGGRDYQVTTDSLAAWRSALSEKPFARIVVFDDLNHLMIAGEGPSTPAEYQEVGHVDQRVVEEIAEWITGR